MKKIILLCALCVFVGNVFAQKETFDVTTYTIPKHWRKQPAENAVQFSKEDAAKGTYCIITLYKAVPGTADSKENFDLAWVSVVKEMVTVSAAPEMQPPATENGWETQSGYAPFESDGNKGVVVLVTATGFEKMVNMIILTNTDVYEKEMTDFLGSVSLKKMEIIPQQAPGTNDGKNSILGSWGKSNTVSQVNNRFGNYSYNKQQYTFNADGSYSFTAKTYDEQHSETLLIKENGGFVINEKTITITPKNSVIEAWSKKNGADNWNQLKSTQKRPLEIVTYQFSIADNNLLLQTAKQTQRDGNFNNGNTYTYGPPGTFTPIKLPGADETTSKEIQKEPVKKTVTQINPSVTNSRFAFTTTNFDDGWTSTVQDDWVEVTKGNMKVLLHYPREGTIFPADPGPMTNAAWDILVAPRYSILKNYKTAYITTYDRPYLGMGYATENATGKNVFIVFFHQGQIGWLEFIAPDKNSFIQQYKFDPETIQWDSNSDLMIPLVNMAGYNKFAVAASDLKGKWTSDFTGIQQLYNVYTGQYAGMNINQSNEEFVFNAGNSYNWKLLAVNGTVGNAKYIEVKSAGQFKVPNNWQIYFSKIESSARTFHAFWSCIKGARVLNLLDANFPGSGIYTKYGLAK